MTNTTTARADEGRKDPWKLWVIIFAPIGGALTLAGMVIYYFGRPKGTQQRGAESLGPNGQIRLNFVKLYT